MAIPRGVLAVATLLAWVAAATAEVTPAPEAAQPAAAEKKASVIPNPGEGGKFFLKSYSTTTWTFLSSFTSTVPYTCFTTGANAPAACAGRRLRRSKKIRNLNSPLDATSLYSSGADDLDDIDADEKAAEEKFFFRLYRTVSTTATITTFSTNRSVTVSASIMCTFAGITFNVC